MINKAKKMHNSEILEATNILEFVINLVVLKVTFRCIKENVLQDWSITKR